jgi:hypothetical protein
MADPPARWRPGASSLLSLLSARRVEPLALHCALAVPVAALPSLAFYGLAYGAASALGIDAAAIGAPSPGTSIGDGIGAAVVSPLAETLLLGGLLWALSRLSANRLFVAAASAVLWGGLHATRGPLWFFGTFWSFYVFGSSYLAWRPIAWWKAFIVAATPHALINLTAFMLLAFLG